MFKKLFKNKFLLILVVLFLWLVPVTISIPDQSSTEVIITAIAVDKNEDEYEVTLQYILPTAPNNSENLKTASQKDKSVHKAVEKLNFKLGKFSGIAHCRFVIFNEEASKDNLTNILDNFLRQKTNSNNIVLLCAEESAKQVLETSKNLDSDLYSFLNNAAFSNELKNYKELKTIGDYYESYFGHNKNLKITLLSVKDSQQNKEDSEGSPKAGSGGDTGGKEAGSQSSSQKEFENSGKAIIIKGSKQILKIDSEQNDNLNLFNKNIKRGSFEIKNFSDENFENANIIFDIKNKVSDVNVYFKDGKPCYDLYLKLFIRTSEISKENLVQQDYEILQTKFSKNLEEAIKQTIKEKLKSAEEFFKQNKFDVIWCNDKFYKFKNKEYTKFLQNLSSQDDFISNVEFNYKIDVVRGN